MVAFGKPVAKLSSDVIPGEVGHGAVGRSITDVITADSSPQFPSLVGRDHTRFTPLSKDEV